MADFKKIINRYKKQFFDMKNVIGIGYGCKEKNGKKTNEEAIVVLVERKLPLSSLNRKDLIPHSIEDYRTDVIEIGKLRMLETRTSRIRPAQPGISIGHYKISAGTLGAIVKDKKSRKSMILSNNHVLANISNGHDNRAKIGDPILQPGVYDDGAKPNDVIANLEKFIPIRRGTGEPQCKIAIAVEKIANYLVHIIRPHYTVKFFKQEGVNLVDCALARPKSIKDVNSEILGIGKVKGIKEPEVGMKIRKSGRTSGITKGEIKAINASVKVNMEDKEVASFDDQFVATAMSKPGDSGALVLDGENNAIGLLFAGSDEATVCNRISSVLEKLNVEF